MEEIEVTINLDGSTQIKVNGVPGEGCKKVTEGLEKALGITVSDTPTDEMYATETAQHKVKA